MEIGVSQAPPGSRSRGCGSCSVAGSTPTLTALTTDTESDLAHVRTLLDRGEVRVAVEQYEGPLLPHSEAPGIVRERDELEAWVRQGVMSADDRDALWAWVQCSSGRDDLPAWKRLLTQLDFRDP